MFTDEVTIKAYVPIIFDDMKFFKTRANGSALISSPQEVSFVCVTLTNRLSRILLIIDYLKLLIIKPQENFNLFLKTFFIFLFVNRAPSQEQVRVQ